jgi:DNA-binding GntR family transcriptional regulator
MLYYLYTLSIRRVVYVTQHPSAADTKATAKEASGITELYARLREMILDGVYQPGTLLPERELARTFGVSRTPMREVLRMLQAEGLIEAGRYQRSRVTAFEPETLDALYAIRIRLETLGIAISVPRFQQRDLDELNRLLAEMRTIHVLDDWEKPHHRFHSLLVAYAGQHLGATITDFAARSERYVRIYGRLDASARSSALADHEQIAQACQERNEGEAMQRLARHLTRTALTVLAQMAPEYEPVAVRKALQLVQAESAVSDLAGKAPGRHKHKR